MTGTQGSLSVRYARWVVRWRWIVLLLSLLTAVGLAAGAQHLAFTNDYRVFFSDENPELNAFESFQDIYTKTDTILIAVKPSGAAAEKHGIFNNDTLQVLKQLTEDAWKIPYAIRVDSPTNYQHTEAVEDDLTVADLVARPGKLNETQLAKMRDVAVKEPFKGLFTQGMVVHETYRLGESGQNGEWVAPADIRIEEVDGKRTATLLTSGADVTIGSIEKMSKSKKNVVDPDDIIASYGADTARFFVLSDSPPDRDVIWSEAGVEGAYRFTQRLWRLISEAAENLKTVDPTPAKDGDGLAISQLAHKTLKAVQGDLDKLSFNKAVARIYELVNALAAPLTDVAAGKGDAAYRAAVRNASEILIQIVAPMTPHLAEECWAVLGNGEMVSTTAWPKFDKALVVENDVTMPVQINGKKRAELTIARDADQTAVEAAALALDVVKAALGGKPPKKIIVVPQRIVNIVA